MIQVYNFNHNKLTMFTNITCHERCGCDRK